MLFLCAATCYRKGRSIPDLLSVNVFFLLIVAVLPLAALAVGAVVGLRNEKPVSRRPWWMAVLPIVLGTVLAIACASVDSEPWFWAAGACLAVGITASVALAPKPKAMIVVGAVVAGAIIHGFMAPEVLVDETGQSAVGVVLAWFYLIPVFAVGGLTALVRSLIARRGGREPR